MKKGLTGFILIFAVLAMIPLQSYASSPKETVKAEVDKVIATLSDPQFKDKPRDFKIEKVGTIIDGIFDYQELSKRTLGRN